MKCILGKKLGMTTLYDEKKGAITVTLLECSPNNVSFIRNVDKDGYTAVQLETKKTEKVMFRKEFRCKVNEIKDFSLGNSVTVDVFSSGDKVVVSGTTKAKGFQGVMKRHGFHGSPATHGHRHDHRAPGSIGSAYPQHVLKGKKMAGRMGGVHHTSGALEIVLVDSSKNLIGVAGSVAGVSGRIVEIVSIS